MPLHGLADGSRYDREVCKPLSQYQYEWRATIAAKPFLGSPALSSLLQPVVSPTPSIHVLLVASPVDGCLQTRACLWINTASVNGVRPAPALPCTQFHWRR